MFARRLWVRKKLLRPSNANFVRNQLTKTIDRVRTEGRVKSGWNCYLGDVKQHETERTIVEEDSARTVPEYVFDVELVVFCVPKRGRRDDVMGEEFEKIAEIVGVNVKGKKFELREAATEELTPEQVDQKQVTELPVKEKKPRAPRKKKEVTTPEKVNTETVVEPVTV